MSGGLYAYSVVFCPLLLPVKRLDLLFPLLFAGSAHGQTTTTEIDYTGSLYGYYRMEYGETDQDHLPPVKSFLDDYRKSNPSQLLIGMGDNFGPEFGAAIELENLSTADPPKGCRLPQIQTSPGEPPRPESLYKNDDRVPPKADCDNVLNFLMHAGFRAVVPGSQDFMYTALWLREAALRLSVADKDTDQNKEIANSDNKIQLLAANLRITEKGGGGGKRCPLLFSQDPSPQSSFRCVGDGTVPEPLDWLDRLDRLGRPKSGQESNSTVTALQQLASESAVRTANRRSELNELISDEIAILESAWGTRLRLSPQPGNDSSGKDACASQEIPELAGKGQFVPADLTKLSATLDQLDLVDSPKCPVNPVDRADLFTYRDRLKTVLENYSKLPNPSTSGTLKKEDLQKILGACAQDSIGSCFILTDPAIVAAQNGLLRTIAIEEEDIGYTVALKADRSKVLIVGVTGQSTMTAVSQTNLTLCAGDHGTQTYPFGACGDRPKHLSSASGAQTFAADPVAITEAIVRGAELRAADLNQGPFETVVVMAQMPHTEAEVLSERVSRRLFLAKVQHPVDVVFSEAESGFGTPQLTLSFPASTQPTYSAPVVAPKLSYSSQTGGYPGKVSRLTLNTAADHSFSMTNKPNQVFDPPPVESTDTTISLLFKLAAQFQNAPTPQPNVGTDPESEQRAEFALLEDLQKAQRPKADVVLLQSRDVELDKIGPAYTGYAAWCNDSDDHPDFLCRFHVALDRVFWKGDFIEYVAVTGKDLKTILQLSEQKMAEQAQLADTGITKEWLISYGIVQSALSNLTEISENDEPLWIPVDPTCTGNATSQSTYCVGGTPVSDDSYYWLLTSDQLAEDKAVYGTLQSLPSANHELTQSYVTRPLSEYFLRTLKGSTTQVQALGPPTGTPEETITADNQRFQQAPLWQVEFAKLVASFSSRQPVGGDTTVQSFQGVSDSRATAPAQQDLDLELANRVTGSFIGPSAPGKSYMPFSLGEQSAFSYDRAVIGNLTSRPVNASYVLNNITEGAFVQIRLHGKNQVGTVPSVWSLPRSLLVFTPRQYQLEIDNPYLFFPFAAGSSSAGELTVKLPRISAWTDRGGYRLEFGGAKPKSFWGGGSFLETGMEFSTQNGNLEALTLQDGTGTPKTCQVLANMTLAQCFTAAKFVINSTTTVVGSPTVRTLHTPGFYWTFHFQNLIYKGRGGEAGGAGRGKQISLVTDASGDYYFGRSPSAELYTQSEYAIPLSIALVLPSIGNLSFAPTYSGFFYQPQLSSSSLKVNSFSIAARWYFARDARVPIHRQAPLPGPATADQTHTGKGH